MTGISTDIDMPALCMYMYIVQKNAMLPLKILPLKHRINGPIKYIQYYVAMCNNNSDFEIMKSR